MRPAALLVLLAACDDLSGLGGEPPPLATMTIVATSEVDATRLRVAIVWGAQWLPEPLCILPTEDPALAAVIAAGCRDVLGFTPARVGASVPLTPGMPAELPLFQLPSADVMVGGVTARVAYASLVVFDDRDADGTLRLARPVQLPAGAYGGGRGGPDGDEDGPRDEPSPDVIYGASFVSMTAPDRRLAFREGAFVTTGFYPRSGCGEPLPGLSILSAGGFTREAAIAASLANQLPAQDPASCAEDTLDSTVVEIELRPPPEIGEVACEPRALDSSVDYRDPPLEMPDLSGRAFACTSVPTFAGDDPRLDDITQLVVTSAPDEQCKSLTHYTLVGCDDGRLTCDDYEWDLRATPPPWWPCTEAP